MKDFIIDKELCIKCGRCAKTGIKVNSAVDSFELQIQQRPHNGAV